MQPTDLPAERRLLGILLLNPDLLPEAMADIGPADLSPPHHHVYAAIGDLALSGRPVTVQSLARELGEVHLAEAGGLGGLSDLLEGAEPSEFEFWRDRVLDMSGLRRLWDLGQKAVSLAEKGEKPALDLFAEVEESLITSTARGGREDTRSIDAAVGDLAVRLQRYLDDPRALAGNLRSGWTKFDYHLDGCDGGNVTTIYAPSGRFKSMFVQNIGLKLARAQRTGLWFTTEMTATQVAERVTQLQAQMNFRWLRRDGLFEGRKDTIWRAMQEVGNLPFDICDRGDPDIGYVSARIAQYKRFKGLDYVIMDLADNVTIARYKDDDISAQRAIHKQFKAIAKRNDVHIFLTTHIKKQERQFRKVASIDPEEMTGSAAKQQDADATIGLAVVELNHAEQRFIGLTREQIEEKKSSGFPLWLLATISKNRHGDEGHILYTLDLARGGIIEEVYNPWDSTSYGYDQRAAGGQE